MYDTLKGSAHPLAAKEMQVGAIPDDERVVTRRVELVDEGRGAGRHDGTDAGRGDGEARIGDGTRWRAHGC